MKESNQKDNLVLRSKYREEVHKLWSNNKHDDLDWIEARKIKYDLLKIECNDLKLFYRYRSFVDWDEKRFKSEMNDIKQNKLVLVSPLMFNDPYDCWVPTSLMKGYYMNRMKSSNKNLRKKEIAKLVDDEFKSGMYDLMDSKQRRFLKKKYVNSIYEKAKTESETLEKAEKNISDIKSRLPIICFSITPNDMYFWSHYGGTHKGYCIEYEFENDIFSTLLHPVEYVKEWPDDFKEMSQNGSNAAFSLIKSFD